MDLEIREKAENKVLLLFFLNRARIPVSNMQLTRIMLENRFIIYSRVFTRCSRMS